MTDPMTTPPLDLTALRDIANAATEGPWRVIEGDDWDGPGVAMDESGMQIGIAYICEKFGQGEPEGEDDAAFVAAFDPPTVLALLDRAEAAERDLAAVTVSRDGWQTRAEAAESKVAAVEALHTKDDRECALCRDAYGDYVHYPCPTITALDTHTPETETP